MKKGDIIEGTIENYSFPNRGSFRYEDQKITVKNALPGANVRIRITKKKSGAAEGMILDTLKSSPYETKKPVCPHFYECGGCRICPGKELKVLRISSSTGIRWSSPSEMRRRTDR